ncbi:MAG: redoxin domain-containing protein [SAR324 cluster bacterium]|nr:redoxin domain-containing protein [SAR324 cluster bacterium]
MSQRASSLTLNPPDSDLTLPDQDGFSCSLADFRGQWALLFFYPKDGTPG